MNRPVEGDAVRYMDRVRFLTKNYGSLQGLRFVPLGTYFLLGIPYDATPGQWKMVIGPLLGGFFLASVAAYFLIGRYYRRVYGLVRPSESHETTNSKLMGLWTCFLIAYLSLIIINLSTGMRYWWLIGSLGAALIVATVLIHMRARGYPRYFPLGLSFAVLLLLSGHLPALTSGCTGGFVNACVVQDVLIGTVLVTGGIFNHLLLVRSMKPLPEEGNGGAI